MIRSRSRSRAGSAGGLAFLSRSVARIFSSGLDGAMYDSSDAATLKQVSTGATPVTAVNDPVGLHLDKRLGLLPSTKGVYLPAAGSFLSSPDRASNRPTGNITMIHKIASTDYAATQVIYLDGNNTAISTVNMYLYMSAGSVVLSRSNGANTRIYTSTVTLSSVVANGASVWVKVYWQQNVAGVSQATFSYSTDGATYTQLGAVVTNANTGAGNSDTTGVRVGMNATGTVTFQGKIYSTQILGADGVAVTNFLGTDYTAGTTLTSSTTGEVYTLNGQAYIAPDGNHSRQATAAARPTWQVDAGGLYRLEVLGIDDNMASVTGGGGSTGFFWCGSVLPSGGAGTDRDLWEDRGVNTGYTVEISAANKLAIIAGNGAALTTLASTATVDVGTKYVLTAWDDGVNLNVQINNGVVESVARPAVAAGTAAFTRFKSNAAASDFFIGYEYASVYVKNSGLTASERATVKSMVAAKAGIAL